MKAADKQVKYLKKLGLYTKGLTKQEASNIISKYYGKNVYKCLNCNNPVIEENNKVTCCGITEHTNVRSGRRLNARETYSLGSGMISTIYGIVDYVDDGNGNEWSMWDDYDDEH